MKILGILGSPRDKGNTALLLEAVLKGAQAAGAETELIGLAGRDLQFCVACGRCYATGACIHEDDVEMLKAKLAEADGIVLGSPNYMRSVTAQLKTLMDRCSLHVHCFLWTGKYGAAAATAGGSGEEQVAEFLTEFLQHCGARTVGVAAAKGAGVGALVDQEAALTGAASLGQDLVAAIREKRTYAAQDSAHAAFSQRMKELVTRMADKAPFQYEHWETMGWL